MSSFNYYLNDFVNFTSNTDEFIWLKFQKPCGFFITFPFLKDSPTSSLYTFLDSYWRDMNNIIWVNDNVLKRSNTTSIRDWITTNNLKPITAIGEPLLYTLSFNVFNHNTEHNH